VEQEQNGHASEIRREYIRWQKVIREQEDGPKQPPKSQENLILENGLTQEENSYLQKYILTANDKEEKEESIANLIYGQSGDMKEKRDSKERDFNLQSQGPPTPYQFSQQIYRPHYGYPYQLPMY